MALEDFKAELDKLNRDLAVLTARRNEFRPESAKAVEQDLGGVWSKEGEKEKAEAETDAVRFYNRWRLRVIVDGKYHIIARLSVASPSSPNVAVYKSLLNEAVSLSAEPPKKSWAFWRKVRTVADVEADLAALRRTAQNIINEAASDISRSAG